MLTYTFSHIPKIGPVTEKKLWSQGILTWQDYLRVYPEVPLSAAKREQVRGHLIESERALAAHDHRYFAHMLSSREHWRAFPEFADSVAYVDIETTGMGTLDDITMVGLYDGDEYRAYIRGLNLDEFPADVERFSLLVTFFGSCFDLPILAAHFPALRFEQLQVDLCHVLRRLGHRGGLKRIEEKLGIQRSEETTGLSGYDAVRLWWQYRRGSEAALDLLVQYNREDVINLQPLMQFAYRSLVAELGVKT